MAEDKNRSTLGRLLPEGRKKLKEEQLQDEQLDEVSGGGKIPHSTARDF